MSKTAALKNSTALVKSAEKLPALPPKREYADFDAFVANADKLTAFFNRVYEDEENLREIKFEWLEWPEGRPLDLKNAKAEIERAKTKVQLARYTMRAFPQARKSLAKYKRDERWYNRDELYEITGKGKRKNWKLSRRVISEQIGLLLASFQNARPGTPKAFSRMMIEEVYANSPNAIVLESACRHTRRTEEDWPPSIAKLLKTIEKESSGWCDRWCDEYDVDATQQRLEKTIAAVEVKIAEAETKFAELEAKAKAEEEKRRAYREAYMRIPMDERQAYRDGEINGGRLQGYQAPIPDYEGNERLERAYLAGFNRQEIPGLELKANG